MDWNPRRRQGPVFVVCRRESITLGQLKRRKCLSCVLKQLSLLCSKKRQVVSYTMKNKKMPWLPKEEDPMNQTCSRGKENKNVRNRHSPSQCHPHFSRSAPLNASQHSYGMYGLTCEKHWAIWGFWTVCRRNSLHESIIVGTGFCLAFFFF